MLFLVDTPNKWKLENFEKKFFEPSIFFIQKYF